VAFVQRFPFNEISSHVLLMTQEEEHITGATEEGGVIGVDLFDLFHDEFLLR